jgi:predicted Zn-dependent peptidase
MAELLQKEILPRVSLTAVHSTKFKSSYMSVQFLAPLKEEDAALNALVPMVLRRGTERHPDMEALSAALDELYGGTIEPAIRKKGNTQCVGFVASFLDDAYIADGSAVLEPAAQLLGELLLRPATEKGGFLPKYVEGERANLVDRIRAQINDKRRYATQRLTQLMYHEPDRLGDESHAAVITGETLWIRYQALFGCPIHIYYSGSADFKQVERAFLLAFDGLINHTAAPVSSVTAVPVPAVDEPRNHEEAMDVTQGKLSIGLRCGVSLADAGYPAMQVLNALFGATTTSKLFLNVRERLSLCYYASSQYDKFRGAIIISSGVEFDKRHEAQNEILTQLCHCREGKIEPWELDAAKRSVVSAALTMLDSQSNLEDFWLGQAILPGDDPVVRVSRYESVTMEQVVEAAQKITPHTFYFLKGKEVKTID